MRHVYFSFHYKQDIWRANQVRNSGIAFGARSVGFVDRSLWEEARTKGRSSLERMIRNGLEGTSVTAVLIGSKTASRPWVDFEISESIERGNALIGIRIHHLKNRFRKTDRAGAIPPRLKNCDAPIYKWRNRASDLGDWVEAAFQDQCIIEEGVSGGCWALAGGLLLLGGVTAALISNAKRASTSEP